MTAPFTSRSAATMNNPYVIFAIGTAAVLLLLGISYALHRLWGRFGLRGAGRWRGGGRWSGVGASW